jgi:hypothetical protein
MSRTILNIEGTNRTINPRNGVSLFVDLSSNQNIGGVKRFLNNLITNSNIYFNNTANVSRIIFKPNETAGGGGNLVAIYRNNEADGRAWIFDANGSLYYVGSSLSVKIYFDGTIGNIDALGAITGGSLSAGTGTITTTGNISGGSLFVGSGAITGGTITASTALITSIISPSVSSTISFSIFNNINFLQGAGVSRFRFFPTITSGDIFTIFRTGDNAPANGYWYWNYSGNSGYYASGVKYELGENGSLFLTNDINVSNSGRIFCNKLLSYNYSTYQNSINLHQLAQNTSVSSIELNSQYTCFTHPFTPTTTSSKYLFIQPAVGNTTGDFFVGINNIADAIIATEIVNRRIVSDYIWEWRKPSFTSGVQYLRFLNGSSVIGSVSMLTASTISYNNSSDYRLKQDIMPLNNVLKKIMMLNPVTYKFINDVKEGLDYTFQGFLAHECEEVVPMAVTGKKDGEEMQNLDYSKFTPILTAGIQELNKEVEELKIYNKSLLDIINNLVKRVENLENNLT